MSKLILLKKNPPKKFNLRTIQMLNLCQKTKDLDYAVNIIRTSLGVSSILAEFLAQNYSHNYQHDESFRTSSLEHAKNWDNYHSKQMLEAMKYLFSINNNISLAILSKFDSFH